jgi:hypothetical protein
MSVNMEDPTQLGGVHVGWLCMYLIEFLIFLGQQCHFPVLGIKIGQLLKRDKHM